MRLESRIIPRETDIEVYGQQNISKVSIFLHKVGIIQRPNDANSISSAYWHSRS